MDFMIYFSKEELMRKKGTMLVLITIAILLFATPVFASGQQDTAAPAAKPEVTEIVYWQYFYETKKDLMDKLIPMFEAANPYKSRFFRTFGNGT
jgi:ABC-type glycerol-3-phosphate transport system substrate-binding protein